MAKGMISGLIVGGAIGAVSALLLAPKSGKEMREDVASRARTISEKTTEVASNVGQYATDLVQSVSSQLPRVASSASDTIETAKEATEEVVSDAKDNWRSSVKNGSIQTDL